MNKKIASNYEDIKSNIIKAYFDLRNKCNICTYQTFKVVIIIQPSELYKLLADPSVMLFNNVQEHFHFINLFGKTPVIMDDTLPKEIMFKIITQNEYERIELDKLYSKFARMFD